MIRPLQVGLVGCGVISDTYLVNSTGFDGFEIVACADTDPVRARTQASKYSIEDLSVDRLMASTRIECILDLTPPAAHFEIGIAAVRAGKHLYQEKPLAVALRDARHISREAEEAGVRVGCAPDTFLGGGLQTVRALVDQGAIGQPVGIALSMLNGGPERWHPNPDFFYEPGAGPLFDVGPYHVTAAVALLGAVARVAGVARRLAEGRSIASGPRAGEWFDVAIDTTVHALLEHESGPVTSLVTSFDAPGRASLPFELHGTSGSIDGPDPNEFGGPVRLRRGEGGGEELPLVEGAVHNARGIGLEDMARAIAGGRPHRASGELALHVLEVMHGVLASAETGRKVDIVSRVGRPAPLREVEDVVHGAK